MENFAQGKKELVNNTEASKPGLITPCLAAIKIANKCVYARKYGPQYELVVFGFVVNEDKDDYRIKNLEESIRGKLSRMIHSFIIGKNFFAIN